MLLQTLKKEYGGISFQAAKKFAWSPEKKVVFYDESVPVEQFNWSLLHEVAHALLEHSDFDTDFSLLQIEVDAWERAKKLAKTHDITIDEDHIQDCLDTYREWLHRRSKCPECQIVNPQIEALHYQCFNCGQHWSVSDSQLCSIQIKEELET